MKKIMFNDRYGLTEAVLQGRKTVTRRLLKPTKPRSIANCLKGIKYECMVDENDNQYEAPYYVGEIVAVAQSYFDIWDSLHDIGDNYTYHGSKSSFIWAIGYHYRHVHHSQLSGWANKVFVKSELMPHQIRIVSVRAERLQDITDEDYLEDGIIEHPYGGYMVDGIVYTRCKDTDYNGSLRIFDTPREAYATLIDKISGKGTWERNPYVWRIEFELIK